MKKTLFNKLNYVEENTKEIRTFKNIYITLLLIIKRKSYQQNLKSEFIKKRKELLTLQHLKTLYKS